MASLGLKGFLIPNDFIDGGGQRCILVSIISSKSEEIKEAIISSLGRGVTIYKGERGYGGNFYSAKEIDIIFTVVTRLEVAKLKEEVAKIDRKAFMFMNVVTDTKGGMIKQRPLH